MKYTKKYNPQKMKKYKKTRKKQKNTRKKNNKKSKKYGKRRQGGRKKTQKPKSRKSHKTHRYMQKGGNEDITCYPGSMNFPKVLCDGMEEKMPPNIHSAKIIHPSQTQEIGSLSSLDKRDLLPFEPEQGGAVKDSSYT